MADLSNAQKKDWAKVLYIKENITQKEIAARVNVTEKTLGKWIEKDNWEQYKSSLIVTKDEELRRIYMQINELNSFIFTRPIGERFANSKEADSLNKLAATARALETDTSVSEIIEVAKQIIAFVRKEDLKKAQELSAIFDDFIKTKLQ